MLDDNNLGGGCSGSSASGSGLGEASNTSTAAVDGASDTTTAANDEEDDNDKASGGGFSIGQGLRCKAGLVFTGKRGGRGWRGRRGCAVRVGHGDGSDLLGKVATVIAGASAVGSANCALCKFLYGRRASYFFGLTLGLRLIAVLGSALRVSRAFEIGRDVGGGLSADLSRAPLGLALAVLRADRANALVRAVVGGAAESAHAGGAASNEVVLGAADNQIFLGGGGLFEFKLVTLIVIKIGVRVCDPNHALGFKIMAIQELLVKILVADHKLKFASDLVT